MFLGILTNGRMFSYSPLLEKLVKNDLRYVYISLLGSTEKIHNNIIKSQGFNQTIKGIKNILKYKNIECKVNVTVVSKNINDLKNIVDLAESIGIRKLKFSSVDCKGNVYNDITMIPKLSETVRKIKEAIDYALNKNVTIYTSDLPLCLIKGYEQYIDNLETNGIVAMTEISEEEIFPVDNDDKIKPLSCNGCKDYARCKGIDVGYLKINGDSEISSSRKIGNSFLYTLKENFGQISCSDFIKNKHEIIVKNGKYKIYKPNFDITNNKEIEKLKENEQIYIINKLHTDSVLTQLTKLGQDNKCKECNKKKNCARIFIPQKNNPFMKYIDSVKNELNNLEGKVLDIGCGNMFFEDTFLQLIEDRKIDYLGVDPECSTNPKYKVIVSEFEKYNFPNESFDNILLLGSYNHILNLELLFHKIEKELRNNGLLIITDSEPYIILKDNMEEKKKHDFEHYRNASSSDVISELKKYNFKIIKEMSVNKNTCNQWMVVARKRTKEDD